MRTAYVAAFTLAGILTPGTPSWAEPAPPAAFNLAAATSAQARAQAGVTVAPAGKTEPAAPDQDLDLTPQKPRDEKHITETWWFWGAVAGVAITTVAIVLIAGRPLEKPDSDLGDMRAFRR